MQNDNNFLKTVLALVGSGVRVLDLGAGAGRFSIMFAEKGADVTAVDSKLSTELQNNIAQHRMSVEEYVVERAAGEGFDIVFMRNILQFLDAEWVFKTFMPSLPRILSPHGVVAIETFYAQPDPPFDHPVRSLYHLNELKEQLRDWNILYEHEYHEDRPDMRGMVRHFFITQLIVRQGLTAPKKTP